MKIPTFLKVISLGFSALILIAPAVDAKPDKGGGKDKGAPQAQGKGGKDKGPGKPQGKGGKDKDKDHGREQADHRPNGRGPKNRPDIPVWKEDQRNRIVRYFDNYQKQHKGLPPGLAMNQRRGKPLPPGWEKKYVQGSIIEDEYWTSFAPVPYDWFPDLQMEPDTRMYHYGDRIVRVYEPRREILEVIILNLLR